MALYRYFHSRRYLTVKLSKTVLIWSIILVSISFLSYYCGNMAIQIVAFIFVAVSSILLNKHMLVEVILIIKSKIKKV